MPTDMPSPTLEHPLETLAHAMKFLVARTRAKSQQETEGHLQFVDLLLYTKQKGLSKYWYRDINSENRREDGIILGVCKFAMFA